MLFQRFMDTIFADIPGVVCVQDDIAFGGIDRADHLKCLRLVLKRLQEVGLSIQPKKVSLPKIDAIRAMPTPTNVSELRSFLGSINQSNIFIPNLLHH